MQDLITEMNNNHRMFNRCYQGGRHRSRAIEREYSHLHSDEKDRRDIKEFERITNRSK